MRTKSCGCLKISAPVKHGLYKTKIYRRWVNIKYRCYSESCIQYKNYGGRGIKVCDEWMYDFMSFYEHVKDLPNYMEDGYSIDRINNDGNYEPGNIRWADWHTQAANKRIGKNNTSGYIGVCYCKYYKKWMADITINRKTKRIGRFNTAIEAMKARDKYIIDNNLNQYTLNNAIIICK